MAPHAQRLLAASRRESNVPVKAKAKAKAKGKAKAKASAAKSGNGKGNGKGKGKGKNKQADGNEGNEPKEKSPYALAKMAYFEQLFLV